MTSQNIALWALINTQSKGGYSNRKKGRYRKLITITFDWIGNFWWGFQQNNSLKAFYQHPENQEYFKNLYICPLRRSIWGKFWDIFFSFFHTNTRTYQNCLREVLLKCTHNIFCFMNNWRKSLQNCYKILLINKSSKNIYWIPWLDTNYM